ncbi:MAG: biopolymer transporter ExbD [Opitutaceae bacterium]|jgi:biopolymer transport protein ExbD|nr:biopolymer transporter ExbD [Opitutaceae bacterium]
MNAVSELNVTNLVDLAFTLLVIFMITAKVAELDQTIPLNLPVESKKPQKTEERTEFQTVSVDRNGRYWFGNTQVTAAQLRERLRALAEKPKPPVIRIRADLSLQWQQVVALMDELGRLKLSRVSFDTRAGE